MEEKRMQVKGTSANAASEFVRQRFPSRYDEWLASLSQPAREIMEIGLAFNWYPLYEGSVEPTRKICDLFYDGKDEGAWEVGRFSADRSLRGVYRLFVRVSSPGFIIERTSKIFVTVLGPGEATVVERSSKRAVFHLQFPESYWLAELRIAGWMEQALVVCGCTQPKIEINRSIAKGDSITEFVATWK